MYQCFKTISSHTPQIEIIAEMLSPASNWSFAGSVNSSSLVRPPGTLVPEGLMFYCRCFFCSPGYLRAPSADRRETLPHDRNMGVLYNASPKIRGALPKEIGGQNMQNSARFQTTSNVDREYLRNGSRYPKSETYISRAIPVAFRKKVR